MPHERAAAQTEPQTSFYYPVKQQPLKKKGDQPLTVGS